MCFAFDIVNHCLQTVLVVENSYITTTCTYVIVLDLSMFAIWKCSVAVFTLGLLFAKYSLPEMRVVGLIRGVAARQCLFIDGLGSVMKNGPTTMSG